MSILITGVSSGIGHALATHYLDRTSPVLGISRRRPDLCGRQGFAWTALDLARLGEIPPALESLVPRGSTLDLVVLNAGILGEIKDIARTSQDELHAIMDINLWSNEVLMEELWKRDVRTPQVIAISSGAGVKGHRGWGGYAISKAALNMLVQIWAAERPEVHFTALAPGLVDTAMQEYMRTLPDTPEYASIARLKAAHGTPAMPDAPTIAKRLVELIPALRERPSGSYVDVRNL